MSEFGDTAQQNASRTAAAKRAPVARQIMIWLAVLGLLAVSALQTVRYGLLNLRIAFADEQTSRIAEFAARAKTESEPRAVAGWLGQVIHYYPAGTKQSAGGRLDIIVERLRSEATTEIIAHLRTITGKDLGADPAPWLAEYAP